MVGVYRRGGLKYRGFEKNEDEESGELGFIEVVLANT
jgi:hypothetical protein